MDVKHVDWPAVGAAVVDEERAAWMPADRDSRSHEAFTRAHVELLRDCGCDREQVLDYARQFLNPAQLAKFASDLGSYGL